MAVIHLVASGRVQGVGYRWFIRETARRLELRGWVRNRADGSVEIVASGDASAVNALAATVRTGPPGAHVTSVVELSTDGLELLEPSFTIQH